MKKTLVIVNILLLLSLAVCCALSFGGTDNAAQANLYNNARLLLADDLEKIESGDYAVVTNTFYAAGLDGEVIYSDDKNIAVGEKLSLQEILQSDHRFSSDNPNCIKLVFPITSDGAACGFAVFTVQKSLVQSHSDFQESLYALLPLFIWCVCAAAFFLLLSVHISRKMLNPIKEISRSAEAIINGDLDKTVIQKSSRDILGGEMNRLCYSFELMRDELKAKSEREKQLQTAHKELLCCMSHDLRTPISTIKAHAEAMRDGLAATDEKRDKYIATIITKTDVVSHMISDLLDHSNAECNQLSIVKSEFYITEYFDALSRELEIYCRKFDTELICERHCPKILVSADRGRINQVIYNLVENAVKYNTNNDKKIWLSCNASLPEKKIYISVMDNGNGVSMSDISFVFDRFYRAEKSRSMQIPGAGLGLSICKYIVEAHGGEITLESDKDKGAVFTFYLNFE